jgi:hypothetical protein
LKTVRVQPTPAVLASLRDEVRQLNRLVDDLHTLSVADLWMGMRCDLTQGDAHAELWRVVQRFGAGDIQQGLVLRLPPESAPPIPFTGTLAASNNWCPTC